MLSKVLSEQFTLTVALFQLNKFLDKFITPKITELSAKSLYKDPKSYFSKNFLRTKRGLPPNITISETGPDHQKIFTVGLFLNDRQISLGTGASKQKAEEDAALNATKLY